MQESGKGGKTIPLIECLCRKNKDILATVTSADIVSRFVTALAPIALELIDTFKVELVMSFARSS